MTIQYEVIPLSCRCVRRYLATSGWPRAFEPDGIHDCQVVDRALADIVADLDALTVPRGGRSIAVRSWVSFPDMSAHNNTPLQEPEAGCLRTVPTELPLSVFRCDGHDHSVQGIGQSDLA
jgi:hypothetical protein